MATDIVVLDIREQTGGLCSVRFACWIGQANTYPNPNFASAYQNMATDPVVGNSASGYLSRLQAGSLVEETYQITVPSAWVNSANTWSAAVEAIMLSILNARVQYKAGNTAAVPSVGLKYGVLHDSNNGWNG